MRVRSNGEIYEGTGVEIMDRLRLRYFTDEDFPGVESYIRFVAANFTRTFGLAVALPETSAEDMADAMIRVLVHAGAMEILDENSGPETNPSLSRERKETGDIMKIRIDDTIYEGTAVEILDRLRGRFDEGNDYPDTESYIRQLRRNFISSAKEDCDLPKGGLEDRARTVLFRFADVGSLEILPDDDEDEY